MSRNLYRKMTLLWRGDTAIWVELSSAFCCIKELTALALYCAVRFWSDGGCITNCNTFFIFTVRYKKRYLLYSICVLRENVFSLCCICSSERPKFCWASRFVKPSTCGHSVASSPNSSSAGRCIPDPRNTTKSATYLKHKAYLPSICWTTLRKLRVFSTAKTPRATTRFGGSKRPKNIRPRPMSRARRPESTFSTAWTTWHKWRSTFRPTSTALSCWPRR